MSRAHRLPRHGTRDVAGAVVASTLTTCVIFLPVLFTRTTSGALFQALALVVVFALLCSLLVALTLVPMLASKSLSTDSGREAPALAARFGFSWPRGTLHRLAARGAAASRANLRGDRFAPGRRPPGVAAYSR